MTMLERAKFRDVVVNAPLVSIDLIVRNEANEVLLGLRRNGPAKNSWFVPGGRIWKDEKIAAAFKRITDAELGTALDVNSARFMGVWEHFHEGNFADQRGFGTHYIVLAHEVKISTASSAFPLKQHSDYLGFSEKRLLEDEKVHPYTKDYFR